jgi:hypothetical protein
MLRVVTDEPAGEELAVTLDEICREGARRMLATALEAEVDAYLAAHAEERDERGRRLVVRNGRAEPRTITTAAGALEIEAPRVNDKRIDEATGERCRFASSIVPPWCRKSPKVTEVLPLLYLHGLSTGDFGPALSEFFGSAAGLSASVVNRLTKSWQDECAAFARRSLAGVDYVYVWVDGVHFNVRLEEEWLCCLVMVGVRADGTKELVAIADGYRWAPPRRPGQSRSPVPQRSHDRTTQRARSGSRRVIKHPAPSTGLDNSSNQAAGSEESLDVCRREEGQPGSPEVAAWGMKKSARPCPGPSLISAGTRYSMTSSVPGAKPPITSSVAPMATRVRYWVTPSQLTKAGRDRSNPMPTKRSLSERP